MSSIKMDLISNAFCVIEVSDPRWDTVVKSFNHYDVHYLNGYVSAFQTHGDGMPLLFYYADEDIRAIHVVMKRDIAEDSRFKGKIPANTYFDLVTPYGYGGWILEGDADPSNLYASYTAWCKDNGIVCEFVRFSLFSNSIGSYYGQVIPRINNVVRDLDRPMDEMLMAFEHKVRKNYKRALSSGLQLLVDTDGSQMDAFLDIYYATMDRNSADDSYYFKRQFYQQINAMKGNYAYFHAVLDGKIISTELVIMGSENMYSYLGGTNEDYFAYRCNDFLKCEIIRWGIENGYKRFVLGGGYGADDGIFRYKKSFAPEGIVQFSTGQAVFDEESYQKLIEMREELPEGAFFPRYRA